MTASIVVSDREETAQRLLASSARKSYDPMVEVDWEA
ncbi:MAG: diiron oxygenase, partial [Rhodococcus sp. (in: high G+C Gram-positive bacteria)]